MKNEVDAEDGRAL